MSELRKAAQQALEALEDVFGKHKVDVGAINALRAALAEPEQDVFCDSHCTWRDHRPDCVRAETEHEHNCYGDGNVYRGVRSKDSSVTTYFVRGDLAEPEHEPVAWMADDGTLLSDVTNPKMYTPLYTAPTPRKPLTEDQIVDIWAAVSMGYDDEINIIELARAIERAHGITGDSNE